MKGTTLEPRRKFYAGLLPLLLTGGLALNCSSNSDNSKPVTNGGASGNVAGANSTVAGAAGGSAVAGAGGTTETGGMQPGPAGCVPSSTKHMDGLCYCQPSSLTYCSDACADTKIDPDHCGSCTTKCTDTQGCSASKCGATPTALVPANAGCGAIRLIVSGTTLYWTDEMHGTVNSIPVAGGTAKVIATGEMGPTTLAVSGTSVYWFAKGAKSIRKKLADGTGTASDVVAASVVTTACTGVDPMLNCAMGGFTVTAAGDVYYSIYTKIYKLPAAGGAAITVGHEDTGVPRTMAVEGDLIGFPADVNGDVDIITEKAGTDAFCKTEVNADNTNCIRVARSQGSLIFENVFILNKVVYWVDGSQVKSNDATNNDSSHSNVTVSGADASLSAFTVSGSSAFFADKSETGMVYTSPLTANSDAQLIARKQKGVTSIAADAGHAYWATADCSIMSLPLGSGISTL